MIESPLQRTEKPLPADNSEVWENTILQPYAIRILAICIICAGNSVDWHGNRWDSDHMEYRDHKDDSMHLHVLASAGMARAGPEVSRARGEVRTRGP
jgi:hypothetical protein